MPSADPAEANRRASRINQFIADYLRTRDTAQAISDAELVSLHPELMPELAAELKKVRIIEAARHRAQGALEDESPVDAPHATVTRAEKPLPRAFGRYEVRGYVGRGGFADVYVGHDEKLDCAVAIKVQRPDRRGAVDFMDQVLAEARRHSRLRHPGIVRVFDVGAQDGLWYIVADLVEGPSLRDWLADHRPTRRQAIQIAAKVAEALAYAHSQGIVHRDIKPANIILTQVEQPVLVDLGLALNVTETVVTEAANLQPAMIVGTYGYMSPEQARGATDVDGRSDIYSLGAVLYEMLAGGPPFGVGEITEMLRQIRENVPVQPRRLTGDLAPDLKRICLKAMANRADKRYATATELALDLNALLGKSLDATVAARVMNWTSAAASAVKGQWRFLGKVATVVLFVVVLGFVLGRRLNPGTNLGVTAPPLTAEVDRRNAERVLGLGGAVDVEAANGVSSEVTIAADLPRDSFRLRWIMMPKCQAVDEELVKEFRALKSLTGVDLYATPIADNDVKHLAAIPSLTDIFLHFTAVSDDGLSDILRMPRLRRLNLAGTRITDATLRGLAGNSTLHKLDVSATAITDNGLKHVSDIPFLEILSIGKNNISDDGLRQLISLQHIEEFDISETQISERGLDSIDHWPLKKLVCSVDQVSSAWIAQYKMRHPACSLHLQ